MDIPSRQKISHHTSWQATRHEQAQVWLVRAGQASATTPTSQLHKNIPKLSLLGDKNVRKSSSLYVVALEAWNKMDITSI